MRVLLTTLGTAGDIHPYIGVARELKSHGHTVEMLVNPYFEKRVRGEGLGFRELGVEADFLSLLHHADVTNQLKSTSVIINDLLCGGAPPTVAGVEASLREFKPDLVVRHHISAGSRWVCEREKVPFVTGVLAPAFWFSEEEPIVSKATQDENPPRWRSSLRRTLGRYVLRFAFDRPMNRMRKRFGEATGRDLFFHDTRCGDAILGLWSTHFRGPKSDDPKQGVICGFPFFDRTESSQSLASDLARFLDECEQAGQPPIAFTFGTLVAHHARELYGIGAEVCRTLGRRGLLLTGSRDNAPLPLPPGVAAFDYAPYSLVLPRCAAIIHHGGVGTTGQALRAGKPTVIVPHLADQFDNAARAARLGVSETIQVKRMTTMLMVEAVSRALGDEARIVKARELGAKIAPENGAARACEVIERSVLHGR